MIKEYQEYEGQKIKVFTSICAIGGTLKKASEDGLTITLSKGEGLIPYTSVIYVQAFADSEIDTTKSTLIKP